ncbi:uncharacterized protein LOC131874317 [Cryptomeria japonica]|uniref:uncharacterized protein LOC131874317 n=1 Tax=Cryptomeria japonica TaxID=3369 RepID=UPI0027D9E23B|nr:uncharacterized protein LOC131874317 [Cryptomeria japonica]
MTYWDEKMRGRWFGLRIRSFVGPAGIGCCMHDEVGTELARAAKPIGLVSNNRAEILALIEGLLLYQNRGIRKLAIEGDSAIIINGLRKGSLSDWKLNVLLTRALCLLNNFEKLTFNHIYREGNSRADALANARAASQFIS